MAGTVGQFFHDRLIKVKSTRHYRCNSYTCPVTNNVTPADRKCIKCEQSPCGTDATMFWFTIHCNNGTPLATDGYDKELFQGRPPQPPPQQGFFFYQYHGTDRGHDSLFPHFSICPLRVQL